MERLISMTDFVINYSQKSKTGYEAGFKALEGLKLIKNYANFLKQKLELWMFVPSKLVEGVWVVLEEPPKNVDENNLDWQIEYQEAKDRVLFEGLVIEKDTYKQTKRTFYFINDVRIATKLEFYNGEIKFNFDLNHDNKTIEDLVKYNLELTPAAKKQIGLLKNLIT